MNQRPLLPASEAALVEIDEREGERPQQHQRRREVEAGLARPGGGGAGGRLTHDVHHRGWGTQSADVVWEVLKLSMNPNM